MVQALPLILTLIVGAQPQSPPASNTFELAGIQMTGTDRYTAADIARWSALRVGQAVTPAELQSAVDRLASTGFFKHVEYRYITSGRLLTVTFALEEAASTVPVIFDNFIWFADDEIVAAVRKVLPAFDGTLPATEGVPDQIIPALRALLDARGITGTVAMTPQSDLRPDGRGSSELRYLFSVKDPAPPICTVTINGAAGDRHRDLVDATKALAGTAYSRFYVEAMSQGTLLDLYRRRGYWRASIATGANPAAPGCAGAAVAVQVTEGPVYTWGRPLWTGNVVIPASKLEALSGVRAGDVADGSKFRDGLRRVSTAYGTIGYVLATTEWSLRLDDDEKRAIPQITVAEGAQFRMGTLSVAGLSDKDAEALRRRWKLAPGAIFDASYAMDFVGKEFSRRQGARGPTIEMQPDRAARLVNVRLIFESK